MISELGLRATARLRRLAEETGAFTVEDAAMEAEKPESYWRPDAEATLLTDAGTRLHVKIEAKSRLNPSEALAVFRQLEDLGRRSETTLFLVYSPAISKRVSEMCREKDISYLDGAGNCRIVGPGLFVHVEGRGNVRPDTRDAVDIFAPKSSRISRILLTDPKKGWQVQGLAKEARISLGLASRTSRALIREAFAEERDGLIYARQPNKLLEAWLERYRKVEIKRVWAYTPSALRDAEGRMEMVCGSRDLKFALTQFAGASLTAPMVRYNSSTAYVERITTDVLTSFGFKSVDSGANVSLWTPYDEFVFYDTRNIEGYNVVSPIQLYLDLAREPGRGSEAAMEIFDRSIKPTW
jgi:hypothetical protein